MTEDPKQAAIDEIMRLLPELDAESCQGLAEHAQRLHRMMQPVTVTNKNGQVFSAWETVHVRGQTEGKPLCGQSRRMRFRLVSQEEFERLSGVPKCGRCSNSLLKLRGEKVPYVRENWLKESQENLIRAIYVAGGRQANQWCSTERLFRETKYSSRGSLWEALRILQGHKVIEMKRQGSVCRVRLASCDYVVETKEGGLLVALGKILNAEKPRREA